MIDGTQLSEQNAADHPHDHIPENIRQIDDRPEKRPSLKSLSQNGGDENG
ncbi:hypothetical protein SDC9_147142 [bioreactor metagenome]|uniref:Uncharacterized protein n=1 Tax=bioreactor metagenome TaxID=1076179 RepID=A0A645ED95_9ZZZZ